MPNALAFNINQSPTDTFDTASFRSGCLRIGSMMLAIMIMNLIAAFPVLAQDQVAQEWGSRRFVQGHSAQNLGECTCRAKGRDFGIGSQICMTSPTGNAVFTCAMEQNVTSWRKVSGPCPEA